MVRLPTIVLAVWFASNVAACSEAYQRQQDRLRARYLTGCQVDNDPQARQTAEPMGLPPSVINEGVERSSEQLQLCYLEALRVWPQLEGRVVIKFYVEPDGSTSAPSVAMHYSTVFDPTIGCCIARVAQSWRFPAPNDGKVTESCDSTSRQVSRVDPICAICVHMRPICVSI